MASDDTIQLLNTAAHEGQLDYSKWPQLLKTVLARLEDIVKNTFPIPTLPALPIDPSQLTSQALIDDNSTIPSQIPSSQQTELADKPADQYPLLQPDKQLPESLHTFFEGIRKTLTTVFAEKPPYTIQRLAELLLIPDKHYKTLPAFLRAVDRVVSVSSTADTFPLPSTTIDTNGVLGTGLDDFNGAALTRIPWLRDDGVEWTDDGIDVAGIEARPSAPDLRTESTSVIDGPNGAGSVETVTVTMNGLGRGSENVNGNVPKDTDLSDASQALHGNNESTGGAEDSTEEFPHARGPEEIGMEDMGPQAALISSESGPAASIAAAERAVGRPGEAEKVSTGGDNLVMNAGSEPMEEDKTD